MIKVLGFDNWAGGAFLFERLIPAFRDAGIEMTLLHLGSWGNDPGRPITERVGQLELTDIARYGRKGFPEILEELRPDVVLFMSIDTFAHRAFNRYCRQKGIPTVHLYHGVVSVQDTGTARMYKVSPWTQARFAASKIGKALRFVWPTYAKAMWGTQATLQDWLRFFDDIVSLTLGRYIGVSASDARTTTCGVYTDADRNHAINKYGFLPQEVVAVGNPDLVRFGIATESLGSLIHADQLLHRDVMYLDTGLIFTGWVYKSEDDFVSHIVETNAALARIGRRLVFKPHPLHERGASLHKLERAGIAICGAGEFMTRLRQSCACVVEPTSASLVPALLGLPLMLAGYGRVGGCKYGRLLHTYPRGCLLESIDRFDERLAELAHVDRSACLEWISANSGPLPAEGMPLRVAEIVLRLASPAQSRTCAL